MTKNMLEIEKLSYQTKAFYLVTWNHKTKFFGWFKPDRHPEA